MRYDLVIFGNFTKDTIVSAAGTRQVDGGGFNYGAHVAAMMGLKTAAVTRLAREDEHVVRALRRLGVDALPTYTPHSTHMRLYYPSTNPDERVLTVTQTAGSFTPDQFEGVEAPMYVANASTRGEVGLDVILALKRQGGRVVIDAQGFVRTIAADGTLQFDDWPGREEILPHIDILKTDNVEAKALTGLDDIRAAAKVIAGWGPKEIVLTHRDGILVLSDGGCHEAAWRPARLVGRSGRGDTCIASYAARRLSAPPEDAVIWAAAVTSLKMEAEGPIKRTMADVEEMIRLNYRQGHDVKPVESR
jgi:sugar/nucleoside kinase (ribokinase family)